jgi:hypothetical protein
VCGWHDGEGDGSDYGKENKGVKKARCKKKKKKTARHLKT